MATVHSVESAPRRVHLLSVSAALAVCLAAPAFFVAELGWLGLALLAVGLVAAAVAGTTGATGPTGPTGAGAGARAGDAEPTRSLAVMRSAVLREPSLLRDLSLIALGLLVVRSIPLVAQLDTASMVAFTVVLGSAVALPYAVSRWVYRDRAIGFPWRGGSPWGAWHWGWLVTVLVLGVLLLPFYFISSGVYANWPVVDTPELMGRLFVGVGAVGIWDELFFICTVFALLRRHFPDWLANVLQAIVFVSFLWELGYRAWGPVLTVPFALVQGYIFLRTRSLMYVVTVHLLFDAVVFGVLVYAHNPALFVR